MAFAIGNSGSADPREAKEDTKEDDEEGKNAAAGEEEYETSPAFSISGLRCFGGRNGTFGK
jgi:hypothetical protein